MGRYPEIDLTHLKRIAVTERHAKVRPGMLATLPEDPVSFAAFGDSLPDVLGASDLRSLARAVVAARRAGRPVVWMCGAHVIKVGLGPLMVRLIEEDLLTLLAVNGAFCIHDAELALWGRTSEDVAAQLEDGSFGMAADTALLVNDAARRAATSGWVMCSMRQARASASLGVNLSCWTKNTSHSLRLRRISETA